MILFKFRERSGVVQFRIIEMVKYTVAAVSIALILFVGIDNADAKSKKRSKRIQSHGHGHGHGHAHQESNWILGAGVSMSQGIGDAKAESGGEEGGDHSGHGHLTGDENGFALGEGHDHGGGGDEGAEGSSSSGPEPTFSGLVGYRITKKMALSLNLGFGTNSGINDPIAGLDYKLSKLGKVNNSLITSFTIPLSEASSKSFKQSTMSISWNPSLKRKKMLYSGSVGIAKTYYSKTIIVEEEAAGIPSMPATTKPIFSLQEDHEHEEGEEDLEVEGEDLATGDREFDRYSTNTSANYRLGKSFLLGGGLGLAFVTQQFGPSLIETSANIARVTWLWNSISSTLSLGLSGSGESFTAPTSPTASFSIFYSYE